MKAEYVESGYRVELNASFDTDLAEGDRVVVRVAVLDAQEAAVWTKIQYVAKLPGSAPIDLETGIAAGRREAKRAIESGFKE
ncbi:hypothetical protein [Burkholderia gladioli]|uniref:hypothetical protein n=1 Tax=Burkholderia gladioli TaxID=28095 RepID=UPI00163E09FC|nr:hypothetical protein [Burkholderia gladioli]MBJ9658949.1 hypothetical protein [Burkholderia gladioli]